MFMMVSGNKTVQKELKSTSFSFETIIHYMPRDKSLFTKIATVRPKYVYAVTINNKILK